MAVGMPSYQTHTAVMAQLQTLTPQLMLHFLEEKINGNPPPSYPTIVQVDMYADHPSNIFESYQKNITVPVAEPRYVFTNLKSVKKGGRKINRTIRSIGTWKEGRTIHIKVDDDKVIGYEKLYKFKATKDDEITEFEWVMNEYTLVDNLEVALCCVTKKRMKPKAAYKKRNLDHVGVDDDIHQAAKKRILAECPMTNKNNGKVTVDGKPFSIQNYVTSPVRTNTKPCVKTVVQNPVKAAATNQLERKPSYIQFSAQSAPVIRNSKPTATNQVESTTQTAEAAATNQVARKPSYVQTFAQSPVAINIRPAATNQDERSPFSVQTSIQSPVIANVETAAPTDQVEGESGFTDTELLPDETLWELLFSSTNDLEAGIEDFQETTEELDAGTGTASSADSNRITEEDKGNKEIDKTFWDNLEEITPVSCIEPAGPLFNQEYCFDMSSPKVHGDDFGNYLENMFSEASTEEPRIPDVWHVRD